LGAVGGGLGFAASPATTAAFNFGPSYMGAKGGIFTRPTRAIIGEAGPEAVIPLGSNKNDIGSTTNVFYNINALDPQSWSEFVRRNPGPIFREVYKDSRVNGPMSKL